MRLNIDVNGLDEFKKNRGKFKSYFIWPILNTKNMQLQENGETQVITFEKDPEIYGVKHNPLGPDAMLQILDENYSIAIGTFDNTHPRDIINARKILEYHNLKPIKLSSSILHDMTRNIDSNYNIIEYRAGTKKLQSYFKDTSRYDKRGRLIIKKLEEDIKNGLKPYEMVMLNQTTGNKVTLNSSGLIKTGDIKDEVELLNGIAATEIQKYQEVSNKTANVKIIEKKGIIPTFIYADLLVQIERESYERGLEPFITEVRHLGRILAANIDLNNIKRSRSVEFNLRFENDGTNSLFAVGLNPAMVSASPLINPNPDDTISLYYAIEDNFSIKS